jgi:hypothetical protein
VGGAVEILKEFAVRGDITISNLLSILLFLHTIFVTIKTFHMYYNSSTTVFYITLPM